MSKRTSFINGAITLLVTMGLVVLVAFLADKFFIIDKFIVVALYLVAGAVISGFICSVLHELGHVLFGKANGFTLMGIAIWFFKWTKVRGKFQFSFTLPLNQAGYTEMLPNSDENLSKRLYLMTAGGTILTSLAVIGGIVALIFVRENLVVYCLTTMLLPIGVYCVLGNILPANDSGVRNDGAVMLGLKRNDDVAKVTLGIMKIHNELFNGKTPKEVSESLYFDLPQLPEDDINFALLLNVRLYYYLDKGDFENAKKTIDRLMSLEEYIPKEYFNGIKTEALYAACTYDYNETMADDLMYELEKYLNSHNASAEIRAKLAYILFIKGEKDALDIFYKKGKREANRCQLSGYGVFERRLLDKIKEKAENEIEDMPDENN
ncbi:MAG: hypothetical protein IJZ73_06645 [Clostridia bacterium]|nr:hypothetical protein [Clostridia bacterium]